MGWSHLRRIKGMEVKRRAKLKKLLQKIQWKACTALEALINSNKKMFVTIKNHLVHSSS